MKITAYVPCFNGDKTLPQVLGALQAQSRKADQYVLINDHSTDRSVEIAEQMGFEVAHTPRGESGLGAGRNLALQQARGDILVGIDADVVPQDNFLAEVANQFTRRPEICGLCGRLDEKYKDDSIFDLWRALHMPQHYGNAEVFDPPGLFGSSSAHRIDFLHKVGGWNPRFKTNYEDFDLTTRIRQAGGKMLYTPACQLWHLRRDTLESVLRGCWNWTYNSGDIIGDFDSVDIWAQRRLPWIWQTYRTGRLVDRAAPQITFITCLMPWSLIVRDLHEIHRRRSVAVDLNQIVLMAQRLLPAVGTAPDAVAVMTHWLQDLAAGLTPLAGPPLGWNNQFLAQIEAACGT